MSQDQSHQSGEEQAISQDMASPEIFEGPTGELPLQDKYLQLQDEYRGLEDRLLRTLAEFENFRKRKSREVDEVFKYQALSLSKGMLPVLSNLRRAITAAKSSSNFENLIAGVEMVAKQFEEAFSQQGIVKIKTEGELFDPNLHEALQMLPSELPEQTIVKELEAGYMLHDRVVQPSKVMVSSGPG